MALDLKTTCVKVGNVSPATLYRWMAAGIFPRPVKIGPRRVVWDEGEVDAWYAERLNAEGRR